MYHKQNTKFRKIVQTNGYIFIRDFRTKDLQPISPTPPSCAPESIKLDCLALKFIDRLPNVIHFKDISTRSVWMNQIIIS